MPGEFVAQTAGGVESPSVTESKRMRLPPWQTATLFGLAYFACAEASVALSARGGLELSFWLPCGLYVAVLLLHETEDWPWLIATAAVTNMVFDAVHGTPLLAIILFAFSNLVQCVMGAWLVRALIAPWPTISTLREFVGLLVLAGVACTLLGSIISAAGQVVLGMSHSFIHSCVLWWGSTAMATLILSPFVLAWFPEWPDWFALACQPKRILEAAALFAGLIAMAWWILVWGAGVNAPNKAPFLVFLIWAGIRFGIRGATAANLVLAIASAFCIQHYLKGLTMTDVLSRDYVGQLQVSLALASMVSLVPAIVLAGHDNALQHLRESEEKFSKAFRSSPNGIALTELATGRYIDVNDSFAQIFGYAKGEMLGRTSLEVGVFDSVEHRLRVISPVLHTGHIKDSLLRMRTRHGQPKTLLFSAERIELRGIQCMVLVLFDITERLLTEERLEETTRQLRALTERLQYLREEERTHVAREIHDHLGQLLTALSLDLRLVERRAAGVTDPGLRESLMVKIISARQLADETITAVQKIATELRPAILDRLGLEAAMEVEAQAFQARTGVNCRWTMPTSPVGLAPEKATAVFRIFQEILTNVARHAHATHLAVSLRQSGHDLLLEVDDDGVGIQPGDIANPTSLGLLGMRERAAILGGTIQFARKTGPGTTVVMQIPLNGKGGPRA